MLPLIESPIQGEILLVAAPALNGFSACAAREVAVTTRARSAVEAEAQRHAACPVPVLRARDPAISNKPFAVQWVMPAFMRATRGDAGSARRGGASPALPWRARRSRPGSSRLPRGRRRR